MFKSEEFIGKVVLVTGATGHLGRELTHKFNSLGASVLLVDRDIVSLNCFQTELEKIYPKSENYCYCCDLANNDDRQKFVDNVISNRKKIDCLINNAAFVGTSELSGWSVEFEKQEIETWRKAIEVNLTAIFYLCQKFTPLLKQSSFGNIINIGSIYGMLGPDWDLYAETSMSNPGAYAASKGAIIQLTRWLATSLAPKVRVNCVSPGGILRGQPNVFVQRYIKKTPLGRMGSEEEVANAVCFLASNYSKYITGQNLVVDGGYSVL